jgi:lipoprotein-anchoring transpeptidase ErfK/SrfK
MGRQSCSRNEKAKLAIRKDPGTYKIAQLRQTFKELHRRGLALHGTPDPGLIRHGESAGCIRMTEWNVDDPSHMARRGPSVILEE